MTLDAGNRQHKDESKIEKNNKNINRKMALLSRPAAYVQCSMYPSLSLW